jgi:hypothetical protein
MKTRAALMALSAAFSILVLATPAVAASRHRESGYAAVPGSRVGRNRKVMAMPDTKPPTWAI